MRQLCVLSAFLISTTLVACGGDNPAGDDVGDPDGGLEVPDDGFQIVTPDIIVEAGQEITYCYYTTVDIDTAMGVKRWASEMTNGSHHMIVYFTDSAYAADGTYDECTSNGSGGFDVPVWTYAAQNQVAEMAMPEGVGMRVEAQQHLYIQMHYLNATLEAMPVHVTLNAEAYAPGEDYVRAAAYVTYNTEINLAPGETATFGGECAVPADSKFFTLSTHAHKRATRTEVHDGTAMVFASDDWEEPGTTDWLANNYEFSSGSLTYSCTFTNYESFQVGEGDSAATDEMCMAVGYFYPATGPKFCLNSLVVQ